MSWNDNEGGPWGRKPSSKKSSKPQGFEDIGNMFKKHQEQFKNFKPNLPQGINFIYVILIGAFLIWLGSGFYRVQEGEESIVLRFGKVSRKTGPGLRYHLPTPIEDYQVVKVTEVNVIHSGVEVTSAKLLQSEESRNLMLTGDENILKLQFTGQWVIKDIESFLYNDKDPRSTVQLAANSAVREVIAQTKLADALTVGKDKIIAQSKILLQRLCDEYGLGIEIIKINLEEVNPPDAVIDAFRDVQRARADRERRINEANAYRNSIIPVARGEAQQIIQSAEADKEATVDLAEGEASRFESILTEYLKAPDVTMKRLRLQNTEKVLGDIPKMILPDDSGVVPYLPLDILRPKLSQSEEVK